MTLISEWLPVNDIGNSERFDGKDLKALHWDDWHVTRLAVPGLDSLRLYVRAHANTYALVRCVLGEPRAVGVRGGNLMWLP